MTNNNEKKNSNFLNGWAKPKEGIQKLTDQERRLLERWDRPLKQKPSYSLRGRRATTQPVEQEERYYIPGSPIRTVAQVKNPNAKAIRKQFADGKTLFALSLRYNLREEWIQEIIDNPKETYFAW